MNIDVFLNLNPKITSLPLPDFDNYIKGLQKQEEMAASTNKLDWQGELIASIKHCETIKSCLHLFNLKKDIEDGKPGAGQFDIDATELEAHLILKGLDTKTFYDNWKKTGKFSL